MVEALLEPLVERIHVAELEDALAPGSTKPARAARRAAASLAYLIYTSGSSGAPKGVMIEQRGLSNHLASLISELGLSAKDVIAQTAPQSFVISVWQFLAGPMVGARVHICGNAIVQDPILLARRDRARGHHRARDRSVAAARDPRPHGRGAGPARLCEAAPADFDRRAAAGRPLPRLVCALSESAADQCLWRLGMFRRRLAASPDQGAGDRDDQRSGRRAAAEHAALRARSQTFSRCRSA